MALAKICKQISVFLENNPGHLRRACEVLSKAGVNIQTISLAESKEYGILRMIVDDTAKAMESLKKSDIFAKEIDVLEVEVLDTPGALLNILDKASAAELNIEYMYAHTRGNNGNPIMIMRFEDAAKALKILA